MLATACLGFSIMWLILYSAFPATRKRSKLRMIHIRRATIVAGLLPFLIIELGRLFDAVLFAAIYWNPMSQISLYIYPMIVFLILWMVLWTQWFWFAATRIGWQVNAKWWELVLIAIASLLGTPIAGLLMLAFKPVQISIDLFARLVGV